MAQTTNKNRTWITGAALLLLLLFGYLPAPAGMTPSAMRVIGIFAGTLLLWLTVSIDWPSLLCMAALAAVPELGMGAILSSSFGNATFAFLMFTFMCTYALSQTAFVRRCAVWFVSGRWEGRGPWQFTLLFFSSILLLGLFSLFVLGLLMVLIVQNYPISGVLIGCVGMTMCLFSLACLGVTFMWRPGMACSRPGNEG